MSTDPSPAPVFARRMPYEWPARAQYALAVGVMALSLLARWMLGGVLESHIPFSLTLGVLLPLVLLVRPGPFLAAAVLGWVGALYLFVEPTMSLALTTLQQRLSVALYSGVLLLGAVAAWLSRRAEESRERRVQELERAQRALRDSEQRLRLVTDAVPALISYIDAAGRYRFNNRSYEAWFGQSREEIRGRHMREVLGEAAFECLRPKVEQVLAGEAVEFEADVPYKDGGARFIHANYVPDLQPDGSVAGFYVLVDDITTIRRTELRERELHEQALAATAKFQSVFNQSGIFAGITDLEGVVRESNDLSLTACGYRADEVIGLPFWDTPWWRGSEAAQAEIREATRRTAAGDVYRATLPYWMADGSERVVDFAMHPIRDDAGRVMFLHPTGIDVTERQSAEAQLRRNHETFFNLVQNSPFGVYVVDSRFRLRQVSQGAAKVFENVRPLLGRDFAEVLRIIWEDPFATEAIDRFRHTLATGEPYVAVDTTEQRHDVREVESYDWRIERITLPDGEHGVVCYFYDLSAIKRAQEELRFRGQQFQTLVDQAPLGVLLVDADLRVAQVNPAGLPLFSGIAELVGRRLDEVLQILWPPARADELVGIVRRLLETGESHHMPELREVRTDRGTTEYYDWRVNRITLPDGRVGVVCYFSDISEAVRARQRIVDSEARLRLATSAAQLGLHDYDVLNDSIEWDERTREIWGVAPEETVTYDMWRESVHPRDRESAAAAVGRALDPAGDGQYVDQYRIRNRLDGTLRWIESTGLVARADGRPVRLVGTAQDITERRRAEESIRFHARLLEEVGQAIVVTDPAGVIIYWNRAAEDLYGWSREEAIGRSVLETTVGAGGGSQAAGIMDRLRAGEPWSGEFEVQGKAGQRHALVTNTPMFDEDGTLTAIIGISVDISELKTVQDALTEADRRKDEFLATLAHELRNPLAAIRMALGVLDRLGDDPARVRGMKAIIDRQSAQLVRLIDDLLDVSRITRGKVELRKEPVDLRQVIEHAVDGIAGVCESKGVQLAVRLPREPLVIEADALRFAQVVSNLLNNACKFTDRGGAITVTIDRDGDVAVVGVRDTGIGIPREDLARVFDMFVQTDAVHARGGGGLGIGLSLARSIVAMHGGSIEAHSEGPGRGTELVVRTPALSREAAAPTDVDARIPGTGRHDGAGLILAVDDNADALEAVATMLRMAGYTVDTASDGQEALEKAGVTRPAAVLLDIGLPGMDGYEVARRIRGEPWGAEALLVAMTGWGQEKDKRRAYDAGFDAHLTKPVDAEQLVRVLSDRKDRGDEDPLSVLPVS